VRALSRIAAVAVAGAALYFAGIVNSIILEHPGRDGVGVVVLAIALSIAILLVALIGTGRGDAVAAMPGRTWFVRGTWGFVCVMALVGFSWIVSMPRQHSLDWTPYHNDAIALNECAARLVLQGRDPYTDLDLFACYGGLGIGPDRTTPLRSGAFSNVPIYPSDDQLDQVWDERAKGIGTNEEFVWRPSYPAVSFLALLPVVALGWDTNYLYVACLLVAMALVVARAPRTLRPFFLTALLGAASLSAFTVGGSSDLLYALPLVVAWMYRDRKWAGIPFGIALATKQIAWFFAPFWIIAVITGRGWRAAARDMAIAAGIFALTNMPFIVHDPQAWLTGIMTPLLEPMFARGAGLIFLFTNGGLPFLPAVAYSAAEAVAGIVCLVVAWRTRRTSPELGAVLAIVPLFFAWRSLFSYFFLLPLFALAAVARMPLGELALERARKLGGLTIFAAPTRS
jgi:Glycosyltransferase family 87